jgi:hypothetical protein
MNRHFLEKVQVVPGFMPVAMNTNPGPTSDWVCLKNYGRCAIVFVGSIGTNGQDPTLTLLQAVNVSGGSSKALNFNRVDTKQGVAGGDLLAVGTFTTLTPAAGNTYTHADAAENQKVWVIDIKAEDLDADNGFDCLQASIGDVGTNAQLGTLFYFLHEPRYSAVPLPSAIVN